jgi:acyl-CoA reductase-like NAD-dependent aldehyde dehydrogenase
MLEVVSPYTGEVISEIQTQSQADLQTMLAQAYALYRDRSGWMDVQTRMDILSKASQLLQVRFAEFAELIAKEGAKPLQDARVEARRAAEGLQMCADHIRADVGRTIALGISPLTQGHHARTFKEPIGVVAAISAFNHPLNLIVHQVGPAIAAGCPVIIKPARDTPLSALALVDLLKEAGLADGWCQTLIADNNVAETLVTDSRLGFFSFIGSARVGWQLRAQLAPGVRCALEHGGCAPVIACEDADLKKLVPAVLKGGFYHAGQVCVSVQRVYIPDAMRDEFVAELVAGVQQLTVGDPMDADTDVGPLIRPGEVDRVESWVSEAVQEGAELVCGGNRINDRVYAPTVLVNPDVQSKVSQAEIFGPVVCVYTYKQVEDAVQQANALPVAFQAAVFSQDINRATDIAAALDGSAIMINEHTAFRDDIMPFAGLRHSGLGVGGIPYTIDDMQIDKMIVTRTR